MMDEQKRADEWWDTYEDVPTDGIVTWGLKLMGYVDEHGAEVVIWIVDGDAGLSTLLGGIEILKHSLMMERLGVEDVERKDGDVT